TTNPNISAKRTLSVAATNGSTRSTVDIINGNKWVQGDKFIAYNITSPSGFDYLSAKGSGTETRLEGEVNCKQGDKIAMFFPLKYNYTGTSRSHVLVSMQSSEISENGNIVAKKQNGTLENLRYFDYSYGTSIAQVEGRVATASTTLLKQYTILHLDFTHNGTAVQNISKLVLDNVTEQAEFDLNDGTLKNRENGRIVIEPSAPRSEFDVAVFPDNNFSPTFTIETTDGKSYSLTVSGKSIKSAEYLPVTLKVVENTPWIDINGTRWSRYNLQYDPSVNDDGWVAGYQLAKHPWDYFYTEDYPMYPEGSRLPGHFTTDKFDHFRWGDIANAHDYSYSVQTSYDRTKGNIQGKVSTDQRTGDLAMFASKGKWKLPTKTDFENLMNNTAQYIGYYNDGTNDIIGVLFVPTNDGRLKGKIIDKNNNPLKNSNTTGGIQVLQYTNPNTKLRQFTSEEIKKGVFFPFAGMYNNYNDGMPKLSQPGNQAAYWTADGNSSNDAQATAFTGYYRNDGQFLCPTVGMPANKLNPKRIMYCIRPIFVGH
ncbi:MAG: hypothetical protein HXL36_09480, partial [Prevotellaceae bacterium]|nr:hypothetical protein [Prevotellaceae bacterium]